MKASRKIYIILMLALPTAFIMSCNKIYKKKTTQEAAADSPKITESDPAVQHPQIPLQGIDISHHQPSIDWDSLKISDIAFIFIKATGGLDYTDPKFRKNWAGAQQTGLLQGAYHFYYATDDPVKQAEFFSETVLAVSDSTNLPPVLDVETYSVKAGISVEQYRKDVKKWLELTEKAFGRKPIIYTSTNFANTYLNDDSFSIYHLWLAEYDVKKPSLPKPWEKTGWTFWQQSYSDTIPGIKGGVDHSVFAGSRKALQTLGY